MIANGSAVKTPQGLGLVVRTTEKGKVIVKLMDDIRAELIAPDTIHHFWEFEESRLEEISADWKAFWPGEVREVENG
jgi:hypothetical protein